MACTAPNSRLSNFLKVSELSAASDRPAFPKPYAINILIGFYIRRSRYLGALHPKGLEAKPSNSH